ncbi:hypothetical protein HY488_00200 [Candidatus Woesearchaeota archaeon]|nr:hypothetical protein [Candidatus Woesearchaeota archaeon]
MKNKSKNSSSRSLEERIKIDLTFSQALRLYHKLHKEGFDVQSTGHVYPKVLPPRYAKTNIGVAAPVGFLGSEVILPGAQRPLDYFRSYPTPEAVSDFHRPDFEGKYYFYIQHRDRRSLWQYTKKLEILCASVLPN